ncbi:unnamed protein product [Oikopleura dioica]|uniref:Uncharacterized protein n=1 Tax=Oikopleura dioica TaxID=34765 RepID=E4XFY3_OIKDI|nr:unnamed protein product [Oikopleura dioica]
MKADYLFISPWKREARSTYESRSAFQLLRNLTFRV